MSELIKSIKAEKRELKALLSNKYEIDYFQREYKWERRHVEQLLVDLEGAFTSNYSVGDTLESIVNYNQYYMGPVILAEKGNAKSVVDGQQRLTSITLLLIYLYNNLGDSIVADDIRALIISRKGTRTTFNIENSDRVEILKKLYNNNLDEIEIENENNDTVRNIYDRYCDIESMFPDTLSGDVLPLFADWMREKVVFVEILAYSMDNAYTIFETMNDRGLNLTPTEMMKGYLLTNVGVEERIDELNQLWKKRISDLHNFSYQEDLEFIRAWLRAVYAESLRESAKGAENQDFEKIGTRFHSWIREKAKHIGLTSQDSFYYFIKGDFDFYSNLYIKIKNAEGICYPELETLYLSQYWSIASSLSYPLLMAPINKLDDQYEINEKLDAVSKFLDIFTITRILNGKSITQTGIRYTLYSFVKEIRNKPINELKEILKNKLESFPEDLDGGINYDYSYADRKFVQYLFARIILYLDKKYNNSNGDYDMDMLLASRKRERFVLAPIIRYVLEDYPAYFRDYTQLYQTYALLGNFVLIPNPVAERFNRIGGNDKLSFLDDQNILAQLALHPYNSDDFGDISYGFEGIRDISPDSILQRTNQVYNIIREVWDIENI